MPYDPRMLQMAQMGVGMMGPQGNVFPDPRQSGPQRQKQWWEQAMPPGQPQSNDPSQSGSQSGKPQPSLLQMLMLGGPATYSGTPRPGATSPWGMLGNMGLPGWGAGAGGKS